jgi:hypothetical protein
MEEEKKRNGAEIKRVATITIVFFSLFYFYNRAIRLTETSELWRGGGGVYNRLRVICLMAGSHCCPCGRPLIRLLNTVAVGTCPLTDSGSKKNKICSCT